MQDSEKELAKLRSEIDKVDAGILKLLNQRAELAIRVGEIKEKFHLAVYAPDREKELIKKICSLSEGPLYQESIKNIFQLIMDESKKIQKNIIQSESSSRK